MSLHKEAENIQRKALWQTDSQWTWFAGSEESPRFCRTNHDIDMRTNKITTQQTNKIMTILNTNRLGLAMLSLWSRTLQWTLTWT